MADEVASLLVRITADGSQAAGVLNGVASTVETLANKNASLLNKVSSVGTLAGNVGRTITKTFGVATVAGLTASAKAAGQLNKELANIGTLSVPTERLKEFKGQIQDIAIATGKDTSDISDGTYQVISAFGDAADTMEKVEINAKAAKAGLATTTDSINLTSAVTKAYGDTSATAVQKVADLAFKTVELGQTTFPELAQSMQQVTSLSKELGVSQEELFGAYATLTGVTGNAAEVQTQLKAVYTALLKPSDNMAKVIKKQGYESGYSMIKTLGFAGTLDALKEATGGSEEKMLELFNNVRAMPAVMALTGAQADTFATKLEKMENASGAATKAFEVQTEGVAKTGFTLEQAKVKTQVAAQKFGESAAPLIGDVADIIDRASTSLANLSDEQRQSIINTGLAITKLGLVLSIGGKVLTFGSKFLGTLKAIGTIPAPVKAAVVGIAALGVTAKVAYDEWYNSQYRWSKGLSEGNTKIKESLDKYKNLSDIQGQIKSLKLIIENPDSSKEQVDDAKAKLEEIKALLEQEYKLKIKSDNSNLESTVESLKNINKNEVQQGINSQSVKLIDLKPKFEQYQQEKKNLEANAASALKAQERYSELKLKLSELDKSSGDYAQTVRDLGVEYGILEEWQRTLADPGTVGIEATTGYDKATRELNSYNTKLEDLKHSYEEYGAISTEIANWQTELLGMAALEANGSDVEKQLSNMGETIRRAGLDLEGYAQAAALAMNGVDSLETAWSQAANGDGTALNGIVKDYIRSMQEFGASAQETATGAALIQNGFRTIEEAANAGAIDSVVDNFITKGRELGLSSDDIVSQAAALKNGFKDIQSAIDSGNISGVVNDLAKLGGDMGMTIEDVNKLAHSIGLIPDSKKIELNAEGNYEIVNDISAKLQFLDNVNVSVKVNDDGSVSILDKATLDATELKNLGIVAVRLNAEGNIELLNEAEKKVGIVDGKTAEVTITADASEAEKAANDIQPDPVKVDADTEPAKTDIAELNQEQVTVPVDANVEAADTKIKGLAQTVDITLNYKATGDVPKGNAKGTLNFPGGLARVNDDGSSDPRELIVDRGRAFIPEGRDVILPLSKGAKVYTSDQTKAIMSGMGIPHYASGKNNSDAFTSAKDDWTHYTKTHSITTAQELEKWLEFQEQYKENEKDIWDIEEQIFSLQQKLYSERVKESENWLAHEEKYNGLSVQDYIAGIDRMKAYTEEYYAQGLLNYKEYTEALNDLDEKRLDKVKEGLSEQFDASKAYISEHTYFNDWEDYGDDPLDAYNRVMDRHRKALENGELTQEEFDEYAKSLGSDMFSERKDQSLNWLEEQRTYFGMTDEKYVEGLERIKEYTQQYYDEGLISRQEYNEAMTELNHAMWDEAADAYDDMLSQQQEYISDLQEQFSEQEQALRDSWDVEDRAVDMADVQNQLNIYAGAVTDRGQQKYKELQEQMKQLQRDEELYNLQVANNAVIEELQAEYEQLEADKATFLQSIASNTEIDVSGIVGELTSGIEQSSNDITRTLSEIIDAIHGIKMEQQNYNDSRQINITTSDATTISKYMEEIG